MSNALNDGYATIVTNGKTEKLWDSEIIEEELNNRQELNNCNLNLHILPNKIGKIDVIFEDDRLNKIFQAELDYEDYLYPFYIFRGEYNYFDKEQALAFIAIIEAKKFNKMNQDIQYDLIPYEDNIEYSLEGYYDSVLQDVRNKVKKNPMYIPLLRGLEEYSLEFKYTVEEYPHESDILYEVGLHQAPIFFIDKYNDIEVLNFGSIFEGEPE